MNRPVSEIIGQRQRQLVVHSFLYYHLDTNIVSDGQWDAWAQELMMLMDLYDEEASRSPYIDYFKDWDGSTGMDMPADSWVRCKANDLLLYQQR